MTTINKSRKYFSYSELLENTEESFLCDADDFIPVKDDKILESTLSDFFAFLKIIEKERMRLYRKE